MLIPDLRYVPVLVGYEDNAFDQNNSREVHGYDPRLDFTKYSDNGVIGDLSKANIELGRRLWHGVISTAAVILSDVLACG